MTLRKEIRIALLLALLLGLLSTAQAATGPTTPPPGALPPVSA